MSHIFFTQELEGVATFWRIHRRDGVTLGFTAHDRDLWFARILHRAAPGMLPAAIRRTADLSDDSAEMKGAFSHDSISAQDLAAGRFDAARIEVGAVNWETLDNAILYRGEIGAVSEESTQFSAELRSAKTDLDIDTVPRTSPTCRATFCGPGCALSPLPFSHELTVASVDQNNQRLTLAGGPAPGNLVGGYARFVGGAAAGLRFEIVAADGGAIVLDNVLDPATQPGDRVLVVEGCDHTLATCANRFANSANFQGEPFLPGNDLIARYGGSN